MEHILKPTTDPDMKSSITLATRRIEEIGQYLYFRFMRKRLIPEDMCGDLYEGIVEHLKKYRDNNPEVKKVKRAFITTCANWIAGKLRRQNRNEQTRDSLIVEMIKNDIDAVNKAANSKAGRGYERQVLGVIRALYKKGKVKKEHVLWYVLFHGFSARSDFSLRMLKASGNYTRRNLRRLARVRRYMGERTSRRREKELRVIDNKYCKVMKTHFEISKLSDTGFFNEAKLKKAELANLNEDRKKGFERLSRIKVVPSYRWLGGLLDEPESTLKYGVARVEKLIVKHVRECK